MTSLRVARMLDEIGKLSEDEQSELLQDLPTVLHGRQESATLDPAGVRMALALRERVRARLAAEGKDAGSIANDLDQVREDRLGELDSAAQEGGIN